MIYTSWLYNNMKCFLRCSLLLWILFFIICVFDLAMASQLQHRYISQGNRLRPVNGRNVNKNICTNIWKSFLSNNINELEILFSNDEPSNHKSSSSRNIILPQGSINNITVTPDFRFDSSTLMPYLPMAGCISLRNYYWKSSVSSIKEDSLFGVQIFIFHIYNNSNKYVNINLRILLHSTQDISFERPVAIVLSSFLPRRFYLSVLSYLSHTLQPIHIIMTNYNSDIIITDQNLNDSDLGRIYISVLDSSYDFVFHFTTPSNDDANLMEIREKILRTDLYQYGNFSGFEYNSIVTGKRPGTLWLYDNGNQYSKNVPTIKLVAIYLVFNKSNAIDLVLGLPDGPINAQNNEFYQDQCTIVKYENYLSLSDRIMTYELSNFPLNEARTCSYFIYPLQSPPATPKKYNSVSWLHLEPIVNVSLHLKLTSNRLFKDGETHLVILTADSVKWSTIYIESFFLYKKVHILSNISLSQFHHQSRESSVLISLEYINTSDTTESGTTTTQDRIIGNYIAASFFTVMQTTVYKLKATKTYEIRVNIDDSRIHSIARLIVNSNCRCKYNSKNSTQLSIDLNAWKRQHNWMPTQFLFGDSNRVFKQSNATLLTFDTQLKDCSSITLLKSTKIYGILNNKKYLVHLPLKYQCLKRKSIKPTKEILPQQTPKTPVGISNLIAVSEHGFNVFNDSRFKTFLEKRPLRDRERVFIELTQNIVWNVSLSEGIHLRDCYVTNQRASDSDLRSSKGSIYNMKKVNIIRNGCINNTNSYIAGTTSPLYHFVRSNIRIRFSVGIDANKWASDLSLRRQWLQYSQIEVHLYCGVSRCYPKKSRISQPMADVVECSAEKACKHQFTSQQIYVYYGPLLITAKENSVLLQMSILIILSIVTVILALSLAIFIRGLLVLRSQLKDNRSPGTVCDFRRPSCHEIPITIRKKSMDKSSLCGARVCDDASKLLLTKHSRENLLLSSFNSSFQQSIIESDKSLLLRASYVSSPILNANNVQLSNTNVVPLPLSHSIAEVTLPDPSSIDRPVYSWPLSSADRNGFSSNNSQSSSQTPLPQSLSSRLSIQASMIRDRFRQSLSDKFKVSVAVTSIPCSSNQKLSSNRTTVSGESASNMTNQSKSYKWWSPLSNCSLKKNFVMNSRI